MAAAIEEHSDENGIVWPMSIAPFPIIILPLDKRNHELWQKAEEIYKLLNSSGIDALIDDRDASAGFKFKDADLFGIPLQIIMGKRAFDEGKVEVKIRKTGERINVAIVDVLSNPRNALKWLDDPILNAPKNS